MGRWLILGSGGMLGRDLVAALATNGADFVGLTRGELDVTDETAVRAVLRDCRPEVIVNCAAWTAVDGAEDHEDEAFAVNARGAAHVAAACVTGCGAGEIRLVHISTDHVFAGDASRPYSEQDAAAPRSAYGRSKLAGEQAVLTLLPRAGYVVRTAWLYGAYGENFITAMIRLERERPAVDVVNDRRGQPTWTVDVARKIVALARSRAAGGIYHATSSGEATRFEVAREVFRLLGADPARVRPVSSSRYVRRAPLPSYSVLGHEAWAAIGIEPIRGWRPALRQAFPMLAAAELSGIT